MALAFGTRLGRYEIRTQIGKGGMGEVYLAHDPKLGRDIAIKILPAAFSSDSDRLRRFEQEAQAAGSLNHPNILTIYDVDTYNGSPYVASELLEGETLREKMCRFPLSERKVIEYALQIANGLAAAHEKGIIHRDLKPENIFITKGGRAKILDFGLAKLTEPNNGSEVRTDVPTKKLETIPGTVLGTVGYMSPEQVRGERVDQRSDVFAFGAVLYEMLSGKRAFTGASAVETLNAILKEDPPHLSQSNIEIQPALETIVRHCLEKNPGQRFQSARDLAFDLEMLLRFSGSSSIKTLPSMRPILRYERFAWLAGGVLVVGLLIMLVLVYFPTKPADTESIRFGISMPENSSFAGFVSISPDGRRVAVRATNPSGQEMYYVRALNSPDARPLPGTEGAESCFWSPDSRYLGFSVQGKIKVLDFSGEVPRTVCDMQGRDFSGGTWSPNGVILFSYQRALFRVSAWGGKPEPVRTPDSGENALVYPSFFPDGQHFLYLALTEQSGMEGVYIGSLESPGTKRLVSTNMAAAYAPPGYLLFMRERTLLAQPFNLTSLELSGESIEIARDVTTGTAYSYAPYSVSANGVLIYQSKSPLETQLVWLDKSGKELERVGSPGVISEPVLSGDGKWVAFPRRDTQMKRDIWLLDLTRGTTSRLTSSPEDNTSPVWSPDATNIAFEKRRDKGPVNLYQKSTSGGDEQLLLNTDQTKFTEDWSRDGRFIMYSNFDPATHWDLWVLPTFGDHKPMPFLSSQFNERQAVFSPDGKWVAYCSDESGKNEVYIQSFPATGLKLQVSNGGGDARWRRDGKELFYIALDKKLMSVELKVVSGKLIGGVPKALFETEVVPVRDMRNHYDVSSDGRFLFAIPMQKAGDATINVIVNWTADTKR